MKAFVQLRLTLDTLHAVDYQEVEDALYEALVKRETDALDNLFEKYHFTGLELWIPLGER